VQSEEAVQVESGVVLLARVAGGARDGNGRAQIVVCLLAVRHHHIETVGSAALEDRHEDFLPRSRAVGGVQGALQPSGRRARAHHGEGGIA